MRFVAIGLLSVVLVFGAASGARPNVVLVITDDQGYGDLACHGHPYLKTPHLDALYAESTVLEDFHVSPTCSPTRASLMTGRWSNRTGVWHTLMGRHLLRETELTLGNYFAADYATGLFGKWHLGDNLPYRPEDRGFEEVFRHGGGGVGQTPDFWDNAYLDGSYWNNGRVVPAVGYCTDVFFERANDFIRDAVGRGEPFFAYISTNAPHKPFHSPRVYSDLYSDLPITGDQQSFFGMITNIDENVGKTRQLLEDLGVAENTIFIFMTDNGSVIGHTVFNLFGSDSPPLAA